MYSSVASFNARPCLLLVVGSFCLPKVNFLWPMDVSDFAIRSSDVILSCSPVMSSETNFEVSGEECFLLLDDSLMLK